MLAFVALAVLGTFAAEVYAQDVEDPDQDVADRLAQQEQRIQELEARIKQLEALAMGETDKPTPAVEPAPMASAAQSAPAIASPESDLADEDPDDLAGDVREPHELLTSEELISDEFPASWPMFGSNMRMKIGGYIKADFVSDFDGTLGG
jgi:hypothetical protein